MKHTTFLSLFLLIQTAVLRAQLPNDEWLFGFSAGANGSMHLSGNVLKDSPISGLPGTIIPDVFVDSTYNTQELHSYGFTGGIFAYRRLPDFPWVSFQGDLLVSRHAGGFNYRDILGLSYEMRFKYWYGNLLLSVKGHPGAKSDENDERWWSGFFLRGGVYAGLNLTPENIHYTHEPRDRYGEPEYVERELRAVLKGQNDFGFMGGLGYEKEFGDTGNGIIAELRYHHGTADVLKAEPNGYGFRNADDNKIRTIQFTVGLAFSLSR